MSVSIYMCSRLHATSKYAYTIQIKHYEGRLILDETLIEENQVSI